MVGRYIYIYRLKTFLCLFFGSTKKKVFIQKPWITWITIKAKLYFDVERATYNRLQSPLADNIQLIFLLKNIRPVATGILFGFFPSDFVDDKKKKYFLKGLEIIGIIFSITRTKRKYYYSPKDRKIVFQNTAMLCLSKIPLSHKSKKKSESIFPHPNKRTSP